MVKTPEPEILNHLTWNEKEGSGKKNILIFFLIIYDRPGGMAGSRC